ncbi:CsgG/HfaB family protein [Pelagibaculum spongiae]|uniref:Curli production assembly/transport component CsgG n=1 Tax=Pelagibaculum spongiae TaxID=2080658 RepID=A0A2V1GU57_9GAMM|nr:CsgG/HfaB family protein [Pelagibaculum spongiae]PVZ65718.1 curli production assembly/transport protein CsgG [Pelagibaculum spongiae]
MKNKTITIISLALVLLLAGCSFQPVKSLVGPPITGPQRAEFSETRKNLQQLPSPRGKIVAAIYSFRDQTGQYRPSPASNFSTAVPQGGAAILASALQDSGWFIPLEREGLQNLLTERKIIRASQKKPDTPNNHSDTLAPLLAANVLLEGGIIGYESNTKTGGIGARYFGIGGFEKYQLDQVTVNIRAIDIRSGQILSSVTTSKTILSRELSAGVYRFIDYKRLLEAETGYTTNEPILACLTQAIERAVIELVADGIQKNLWSLKNSQDSNHPTLTSYLENS